MPIETRHRGLSALVDADIWACLKHLLGIPLVFLAASILTPTFDVDRYTYTLTEGDHGPLVEEVQNILADQEYFKGPVDGIFTAGLRKAIANFQFDVGIDDDGIVGPVTWRKLHVAVKQAQEASDYILCADFR